MAMNLDIGGTIGDYQIIGILGAGGMGKVYKVRNVISDRIEALKVLLPDLAHEPELADRFIREIKVQASLEHPNIAALHTALRVENQLLMLMEFVEGVTLDHKLKAGPLPVGEAVEYIAQVLSALGYAHQHGVIHRDIKPANMMLTPQGVVKLMDFGIAKAATDRKLTMTGTTMGSLYYMSPEQIKGATTLDSRSDLYSVGVTLYELVTGRRPFDGDSQFAIMSAHLDKNPVAPITIDPRLPAELNDIILLSVGKEPTTRFQTAEAFRNALLSVPGLAARPAASAVSATAMGGPSAAPAPRPAAPKPAPAAAPQQAVAAAPAPAAARSHRGLWLAVGAVFTALVVVGVIQFGPWKKTSAAQAPAEQAPPAVQAPVNPAPAPAAAEPAAAVPIPAPVAGSQAAPVAAAPARVSAPAKGAPVRGQTRVVPALAAPAAGSPAPQNAPVAQTPAPAQPAPAPAAPPADAAAKRAALQQVREQVVMVATRASVARASLENIRRSQAASGLGLRADITEAVTLANTFIEGANSALNAGDAASARGFVEKAERQVEKVEKFLGR
jgi:serine/threonine-protein kinase